MVTIYNKEVNYDQNLLMSNMEQNNSRVFKTASIIVLLGALATLGVYLSGQGDRSLTLVKVLVPSLIDITLLTVTWLVFLNKKQTSSITPYIIMTVIIVSIGIIEIGLNTTRELLALWFVVVILSIFYFNQRITLYTCIAGVVLNTILLMIFPSLQPSAPIGPALATRYFIYIWATIGAVAGTGAARRLFDLAVERETIAVKAMEQMQLAAGELRDDAADLAAASQNLTNMAGHTEEAFRQIAATMEEVARGAQNQAGETEKSNLEISEVSKSVNNMGGSISELGSLAHRLLAIVKEGNQALDQQISLMKDTSQANAQVIQAVSELQEQSRHIGNIVNTISAIADQTNLLALNAAIEAARAGEQGRGFAVVADEVRKLAEESGQAAASIAKIIAEVQKSTDATKAKTEISAQVFKQQEEAVQNTARMFTGIEKETIIVDDSVQSLNHIQNKVAGAAVSILESLQSVAAAAQQLAASVEEVSAVTSEQDRTLNNMISSLQELDVLSGKMLAQGEELTSVQ